MRRVVINLVDQTGKQISPETFSDTGLSGRTRFNDPNSRTYPEINDPRPGLRFLILLEGDKIAALGRSYWPMRKRKPSAQNPR